MDWLGLLIGLAMAAAGVMLMRRGLTRLGFYYGPEPERQVGRGRSITLPIRPTPTKEHGDE